MTARLAVIIVNFRQAEFTMECLESLLRSHTPLKVIVCDNGSGDGSVERLRAWLDGREHYVAPPGQLARLTTPPLPRPIDYHFSSGSGLALEEGPLPSLSLVAIETNLGFAGGNNVGLRRALKDPDIEYFWLLNNDTVVEPGAATALLEELDRDEKIGTAGTTLRHYHQPDRNQLLNGSRFNFWSGRGMPIYGDSDAALVVPRNEVVQATDFICGASLGVKRSFLEQVGLMAEDYFLYYEEIDWAVRGASFLKGFAPDAIVYHRHGGSIGSSRDVKKRSLMSEYYLARGALLFARKFRPRRLLAFRLYWLAIALRRWLGNQRENSAAIVRAVRGKAL